VRVAAIEEAQAFVRQRFEERGFKVETLLLRNFRYADNYEKSLRDKKVAVQLTQKNRKEGLVNEEKAKLKQIESKGNATITIAQSEVQTRIAKVRAEAELYSSQTHARADKEVNVATAEAKRLKADALTTAGGRYVVALETAKMFDNIDGAVMTPEQYIAFVRAAWALIGVSPGGPGPSLAGEKK
jgi:phage-related baseplate assembly protein